MTARPRDHKPVTIAISRIEYKPKMGSNPAGGAERMTASGDADALIIYQEVN